jgi:hypothetical protein
MLAGIEGTFNLYTGLNFLSKYQFCTKTEGHYFCSKCGIYTHHKTRSNPKIYRVNAGCLEGIDPLSINVGIYGGANT